MEQPPTLLVSSDDIDMWRSCRDLQAAGVTDGKEAGRGASRREEKGRREKENAREVERDTDIIAKVQTRDPCHTIDLCIAFSR